MEKGVYSRPLLGQFCFYTNESGFFYINNVAPELRNYFVQSKVIALFVKHCFMWDYY